MQDLNNLAFKNPIIIFLPEAGFYLFTRSLSILGKAFEIEGRTVLFTRCTGQMPHCAMMSGNKIPLFKTTEAKKYMCKRCNKILSNAQKAYGFKTINLSDLLTDEINNHLDNIKNMSAENLINYTIVGAPVGLFSQFDFGLEAKTVFSPGKTTEWLELFRAHVSNTAIAGLFAQSIIEKYFPFLFLTYNSYSQNVFLRHISKKQNVLFQEISHPSHFNCDASLFQIYRESNIYNTINHTKCWFSWRDFPIPPKKALECWQDVVFRNQGQGSHIYSPNKSSPPEELFSMLNLDDSKKLVVAFTSSYDEMENALAINRFFHKEVYLEKAFPDQISWLIDLNEWAQSRSDVQLIVRIHPREGTSKNYNHNSEHLGKLKNVLTNNSNNLIIVWPDDPVSSYDLLELSSACVTAWSSIGLEASRIGIPTLSWVYYNNPNNDFFQVSTDYNDYRARLDNLVNMTTSWQALIRTVRYYHWITFVKSLDLRETVPIDFFDESVWPLPSKSLIKKIINYVEKSENNNEIVNDNIEQWTSSLSSNAIDLESKANAEGIRVFFDSLFCSNKKKRSIIKYFTLEIMRKLSLPIPLALLPPNTPDSIIPKNYNDYILKYTDKFGNIEELRKKTTRDSNLRYLIAENDWFIWYLSKGKAIRRMSPLLIRLGKLISEYELKTEISN